MPKKHIKSKPGLFGTVYYYDENGKPLGKSRPGLIKDSRVYLDQNGRTVGKSRRGILTKEVFTDTDGTQIQTYDDLLGEIHTKNGKPIGRTKSGFLGTRHTLLDDDSDES
ncbi:MAG: hypothetical protein IKV66_06915 [Clostridia bacterium]|nr:hypothetical protein [Clostridia bacterium]